MGKFVVSDYCSPPRWKVSCKLYPQEKRTGKSPFKMRCFARKKIIPAIPFAIKFGNPFQGKKYLFAS
jgi:hypothetical protein